MNELDGSVRRVDVLEKCTGMNAERAGRLLELLPELGRVSSPYALRLAGLSSARDAKEIDVTKKKATQIKRLLAECMKDALQDKASHLAGYLRHLAERHRADRTRVCLAATLRNYSDNLRHPAAFLAAQAGAASAYPETAGTTDLLAAEADGGEGDFGF